MPVGQHQSPLPLQIRHEFRHTPFRWNHNIHYFPSVLRYHNNMIYVVPVRAMLLHSNSFSKERDTSQPDVGVLSTTLYIFILEVISVYNSILQLTIKQTEENLWKSRIRWNPGYGCYGGWNPWWLQENICADHLGNHQTPRWKYGKIKRPEKIRDWS